MLRCPQARLLPSLKGLFYKKRNMRSFAPEEKSYQISKFFPISAFKLKLVHILMRAIFINSVSTLYINYNTYSFESLKIVSIFWRKYILLLTDAWKQTLANQVLKMSTISYQWGTPNWAFGTDQVMECFDFSSFMCHQGRGKSHKLELLTTDISDQLRNQR